MSETDSAPDGFGRGPAGIGRDRHAKQSSRCRVSRPCPHSGSGEGVGVAGGEVRAARGGRGDSGRTPGGPDGVRSHCLGCVVPAGSPLVSEPAGQYRRRRVHVPGWAGSGSFGVLGTPRSDPDGVHRCVRRAVHPGMRAGGGGSLASPDRRRPQFRAVPWLRPGCHSVPGSGTNPARPQNVPDTDRTVQHGVRGDGGCTGLGRVGGRAGVGEPRRPRARSPSRMLATSDSIRGPRHDGELH